MTHFHDHLKEIQTHILFRSVKEIKRDYDYVMTQAQNTSDQVHANTNKTAENYKMQMKTFLEEINFRLAVEAEKKGTTHTNFTIDDIDSENFKYDTE